MTIDEILFVLLIVLVAVGDGLLLWIAKHLHLRSEAGDVAPSAVHVVALTEKVADSVEAARDNAEATRVSNALVPAMMARIEHALTKHAAATSTSTPVAADPHPAGMVATPAIPVVMPSTAQPHVDAVHAMPEPPWMAELREMKMSMQGMQPAPLVPGGSVTVTVGTGGVGGPASAPESTAQPMTLQNEPAATVPAQAPAVAA